MQRIIITILGNGQARVEHFAPGDNWTVTVSVDQLPDHALAALAQLKPEEKLKNEN
ncbi:MAG: hypothetical protein LBK76_04475 [Verrucomicrobiales bacterium]|jgi:hypothetical protein|nr:hypothetical protein [Verrucomicrobiales bacterium]